MQQVIVTREADGQQMTVPARKINVSRAVRALMGNDYRTHSFDSSYYRIQMDGVTVESYTGEYLPEDLHSAVFMRFYL